MQSHIQFGSYRIKDTEENSELEKQSRVEVSSRALDPVHRFVGGCCNGKRVDAVLGQ